MKKPLGHMETVFKALADATRLRILGLLITGEVCVCDIHAALGISQPKASRHLAYLRRAGIVETRRDGTWMHYRLAAHADAVVAAVRNAVTHALSHQAIVQKDLARLQKLTGCCVPAPGEDVFARECCPSHIAPSHARIPHRRVSIVVPAGTAADTRGRARST